MKRRLQFLALGLVALTLAAGCAAAPATTKPQEHTLAVLGEGRVEVMPDIAIATLGVETRNADVGTAVSQNTAKAQAISEAITKMGVQQKDIQTSNFSVYSTDIIGPDGRPTGELTYIVNNQVTITVRDLPNLGKILDAALQAGANSVQGVTFSLEDQTQAESEARAKAIADAKARAETLAKGAGVALLAPITISESVAFPQPSYIMEKGGALGMGGGGGAVPVSSGTLTVTVTVSVVYEIK